jgi:hypothetical protein
MFVLSSPEPLFRAKMGAVDREDVRLIVYRSFSGIGRAPTVDQIASQIGADAEDVEAALRSLANDRHVVLDADGRIAMAHPFAQIPLGFSVMGERTLWWGGCAWDAFAIAHLIPDEPVVLVATTCPACSTPHAWRVGREAPPHGAQIAHFEVPAARMWDDVVETCSRQRIFCGGPCIDDWVARGEGVAGDRLDLPTLWRLAAGWYEGRLDRDYRRREPAAAAAYFRDAGLTGAFWGLDADDER